MSFREGIQEEKQKAILPQAWKAQVEDGLLKDKPSCVLRSYIETEKRKGERKRYRGRIIVGPVIRPVVGSVIRPVVRPVVLPVISAMPIIAVAVVASRKGGRSYQQGGKNGDRGK